jgi:hypothetical protein
MFSHRSVSAVVALGFIGLVVLGAKDFRQVVFMILVVCGALVLPLACIWFADDMGEYGGNLFAPGLAKPTPGVAIKIAGWGLLIVEFLVVLFLFIYS